MRYSRNLTFDEMIKQAGRYGAFAYLREWCDEYCERDNYDVPRKFLLLIEGSPAGDLILLERKEKGWQSSMQNGYAPNAHELLSKEWIVANKVYGEKKKTGSLTMNEAVKIAVYDDVYIRIVDNKLNHLIKATDKTLYAINLTTGKVHKNCQFKKSEFQEPTFATVSANEIKQLSDTYARNLAKAEEEIKLIEKDS